jgi:hypothetical protein
MTSIELAQQKLQNVTKVTQENINIVFKNMDRMGDIEEKSAILQESSQQFKTSSNKLKMKACCQAYYLYICIITVVLCIIATLILLFIK